MCALLCAIVNRLWFSFFNATIQKNVQVCVFFSHIFYIEICVVTLVVKSKHAHTKKTPPYFEVENTHAHIEDNTDTQT